MADKSICNVRIYKPKNDGSGVASQIEARYGKPNKVGQRKLMVFWVMADQNGKNENGDDTFSWDSKGANPPLTIKLGDEDLSKMLLFLKTQRKSEPCDIFHKDERNNSNTQIKMEKITLGGKEVVMFSVSKQLADKTIIRKRHSLTITETLKLSIVLEEMLRRMLFTTCPTDTSV